MKELMMNDDFADVTLVTEDKKHIKAHKNILRACSPVLKEIVKLEESAKTIIYLRGIHFSGLESIMRFIYLGESSYYEERMSEFLDVARSLEIKELCTAKIEKNDNDDSKPSASNPVNSIDNYKEKTNKKTKRNDDNKVYFNMTLFHYTLVYYFPFDKSGSKSW